MGSELLERINLHLPPTPAHALLLVALVGAIGLVARRRAGGPFALVAALLGFVCYVLLEPHPGIAGAILLGLLLSRRPAIEPDERRRAVRFLREILLLGACFVLYGFGRTLTVGEYAEALRNTERLVALQRAIGLPSEAPVQQLVLRSEVALRLFNQVYSYAFLSTTVGVLVWLYLSDRRVYRIYRAGLGCSAALTLATVWLFPVAPPRLYPASGMVDTHVLMGREHDFLNPYAAVPSNHVGWMVLVGVCLALAVGGWRGALIGPLPGVFMGFTVLATGNHFWLDGVIGATYALTPLAVLGMVAGWRQWSASVSRRLVPSTTWLVAHAGSLSLGTLLTYLLVGQVVRPGFTDFWGYQVGQVSVTVVVLLVGESWRGRAPLFTWETRAIVVGTTWADCLGTTGHLYDRYATYDKLTHFAGTAAATAVCAEVVALLARQGRVRWGLGTQVAIAIGFGLLCGVAWEVYEYLADVAFGTGRVQGALDTRYDLLSDSAGAIVAALLVVRRQAAAEPGSAPARAGGLAEAD